LDSVILDSDLATELIDDAKKFLANEEWYRKLGVPYRRGYLFHGHPGWYVMPHFSLLTVLLRLLTLLDIWFFMTNP
jgi:hypothetical protein